LRRITARGSFDEEREHPTPCRCHRVITGTHPCQDGAPCPFRQTHTGLHPQPDQDECE
jgi:hypothetical protein